MSRNITSYSVLNGVCVSRPLNISPRKERIFWADALVCYVSVPQLHNPTLVNLPHVLVCRLDSFPAERERSVGHKLCWVFASITIVLFASHSDPLRMPNVMGPSIKPLGAVLHRFPEVDRNFPFFRALWSSLDNVEAWKRFWNSWR